MYDSWEGYYLVHMPRGVVKFHKDKQGLPYIDLDGSAQDGATMLMQQHVGFAQNCDSKAEHTMLVKTVWGNYEGCAKRDIIRVKEVRRAQGMMGNPSKKDYKGVVSNHLISNSPITHTNIINARAIYGADLPSI
jgi:hypothetical protein